MNKSIFRAGSRLVLLVIFLKSLTASAQMLDGGVNSAMIRLFGDTTAFTAQAEVRVLNSNHVVWLQMPSAFASTDTKLRVDADIKLIKSSVVTPAVILMMKQTGKDRITSVIRPDLRATFIIYPGSQSYISMPLSAEDAQIASQKLEKKRLGKETIDGHACVKNLSTVKSSRGATLLQATTWNATDLKDFPLQVEMKENGSTTVIHFQNVNLVRPDAKLFDLPAGYKDENPPVATKAPAAKKK